MSGTNGTALPTSTNGVTHEIDPLDLGDWLIRSTADPAPAVVAPASGGDERLAALEESVPRDRRVAELQRDPARLAVLSDPELGRQRKGIEKVRRSKMELDLYRATAQVEQERRTLTAEVRLRRIDADEQVWHARAMARRGRLMDPTSRMASIYRTQVVVSRVLMLLVGIGIGWCAIGVGKALGGEWFHYTVEPLFSVPLLVIMAMHTRAAQNRTTFPPKAKKWQVRTLEGVLFAVTTLLNVAPVLPGLGRWHDTATLLTHLVPPALIVMMVVLHPLVTSFLSDLLVSVYVEANVDTRRLSANELDLMDRAAEINRLWTAGRLRSANPNDPADRTAGPSVKSVMEALGIAKEKCQVGVEAWHKLYAQASDQH